MQSSEKHVRVADLPRDGASEFLGFAEVRNSIMTASGSSPDASHEQRDLRLVCESEPVSKAVMGDGPVIVGAGLVDHQSFDPTSFD
jgi:hypothetical protein